MWRRGHAIASCASIVNHGKGAALRAGFAVALNACVQSVITIDADGQHDPARAPELLAALADADVVIGTRERTRGTMPMGRRVTNALASAAVGAIVGVAVPDAQSGYRAMRREVLEASHATGRPLRVRNGAAHRGRARRLSYRERRRADAVRRTQPFSRVERLVQSRAHDLAPSREASGLMRLLCTNDDGILAHGLDCLVKSAETLGDVTVVAPDREQSATSHSLTLHHPIRPVVARRPIAGRWTARPPTA